MAAITLPNTLQTPRNISAGDIWRALVSFSRQESKILEAVPRTRSAAVTIIIRFSKAGKTVDLNMLKSENGLIEDESLIETGTNQVEKELVVFPF